MSDNNTSQGIDMADELTRAAVKRVGDQFHQTRTTHEMPVDPDDLYLVLKAAGYYTRIEPEAADREVLSSDQIDAICDEAVKLADAQPGDQRALWRAAYHGAMLAKAAIQSLRSEQEGGRP